MGILCKTIATSAEDSRSLSLNPFGLRVPRRHATVKVRVIGHVAGDGRVVAEDLVLHHALTCLNGAEEVSDMIGGVVIARRRGIAFHFAQRNGWRGMRRVPLGQVLLLGRRRPAVQRVALRLRACILRVTVSVLPLITMVASLP